MDYEQDTGEEWWERKTQNGPDMHNRVISKLLWPVVKEMKPEAAVIHLRKLGAFYRLWCMGIDLYNDITNWNHN